jgi:hypothetical protein
MKNSNDLFDLSGEIVGISAIVTALGNQLDEDCDTLTPAAMKEALYGISSHLQRVASDLLDLQEMEG